MQDEKELRELIDNPNLRAAIVGVLAMPGADNDYKFAEIKDALKEHGLRFASKESEEKFNGMLSAIMEDAPKKRMPEVLQEILDSIVKVFTGKDPAVERAHQEFKRVDANVDNAMASIDTGERKIFGKFTQKVVQEKGGMGGPSQQQPN